jgi:hypothetical protein
MTRLLRIIFILLTDLFFVLCPCTTIHRARSFEP